MSLKDYTEGVMRETDMFTPGPWRIAYGGVEEHDNYFAIASPHRKKPIAESGYYFLDDDEFLGNPSAGGVELRANARLIAAAPELLDACRMLIDFIPDGWEMPLGYNQVVAQAREVIAKATG